MVKKRGAGSFELVRRGACKAGILLLLAAISLTFPTAYKRLTHSFHLARLKVDLPQEPSWDLLPLIPKEELTEVLSQEYVYLSRGAQSFVFASLDGNYVLKLFIFDSPSSTRVLESSKTAYLHAAKETGLVYVHLNLTEAQLPKTLLKGPIFKRSVISLDHFRFVLQKRAVPLPKELLRCRQENDLESFCLKLEHIFSLLQKRSKTGIYNRDARPISNFGFIGSEPVEFDFGQYVYSLQIDKREKEKMRAWHDVMRWIEKEVPEWKNTVETRLSPS